MIKAWMLVLRDCANDILYTLCLIISMLVFQATCGIAEGVNTFFLLYAVSYLLCQYLKCVLVGDPLVHGCSVSCFMQLSSGNPPSQGAVTGGSRFSSLFECTTIGRRFFVCFHETYAPSKSPFYCRII
jgi:hypothetical protein